MSLLLVVNTLPYLHDSQNYLVFQLFRIQNYNPPTHPLPPEFPFIQVPSTL